MAEDFLQGLEGLVRPSDSGGPERSTGNNAFDQLDSEFQQNYGRPLTFTGRDTATHIRLHGAGQARDIRVRDLSSDELKFILKRGPELGLNLRDYSKAQPHVTSTGVKITGPHVHAQLDPISGQKSKPDFLSGLEGLVQSGGQTAQPDFTQGLESLIIPGRATEPQNAPQIPTSPTVAPTPNLAPNGQQSLPGMPSVLRRDAAGNPLTHDGYPAVVNPDGSVMTELSITVTSPKINGGKPTNIPSLWKGKELSEQDAIEAARKSGNTYPAFNSIDEAVQAAQGRSAAKGQELDNQPGTPNLTTDNVQTQASDAIEQMLAEPDLQERIAASQTPEAQKAVAEYHARTQALAHVPPEQTPKPAPKAQKTRVFQAQIDDLTQQIDSLAANRQKLITAGAWQDPESLNKIDQTINQKARERAQFEDQIKQVQNGTEPKLADLKQQLTQIEAARAATLHAGATAKDENVRQKFYEAATQQNNRAQILKKYIDTEESGGIAHPALLEASLKPTAPSQETQNEKLPWYLKGVAANLAHSILSLPVSIEKQALGIEQAFGITPTKGFPEHIQEAEQGLAEIASRGGRGMGADAQRIVGNLLVHLPMYAGASAIGGLLGPAGETGAFGLLSAAETAGEPGSSIKDIGKNFAMSAALVPIYKASGLLPNRPIRMAAAGAGGAGITALGGGNEQDIISSAIITAIFAYPGGSKSPFALNPDKPPKYVQPVLEDMAKYLVSEHGFTPEGAADYVSKAWAQNVARAEAEGLDPREIRRKGRVFMDEYLKSRPEEPAPEPLGADRQPLGADRQIPKIAGEPLVSKPSEEVPLGTRAVWHAADGDMPVTVTGDLGVKNGRRFVSIAESKTGIPVDELAGAPKGATNAREGTQIQPEAGPTGEAHRGVGGKTGNTAETSEVDRLRNRQQTEERQVAREAQASQIKEEIAKRKSEKESHGTIPSEANIEPVAVPEPSKAEAYKQEIRNKKLADLGFDPNEVTAEQGQQIIRENRDAFRANKAEANRMAEEARAKFEQEEAAKIKAVDAPAGREVLKAGFETPEEASIYAKSHDAKLAKATDGTYYAWKVTGESSQPPKAETVDQAAHEAATSPKNDLTEPSEAQIQAGNYKKGHVAIGGLDVSIENPRGSVRKGIGEGGTPWERKTTTHYGYIRQTQGNDHEQVDVHVLPGTKTDYSGPVFVINQNDAKGRFDEHKAMIGWPSEESARRGYLSNYEKGWDRIGSVAKFENPTAFKAWLEGGNLKEPASQFARRTNESVEDYWKRSMADTPPARRVSLEEFKSQHEEALREGEGPEPGEMQVPPVQERAKEPTVFFKGEQRPLSEVPRKYQEVIQKLQDSGKTKVVGGQIKSTQVEKGLELEKGLDLYQPSQREIKRKAEAEVLKESLRKQRETPVVKSAIPAAEKARGESEVKLGGAQPSEKPKRARKSKQARIDSETLDLVSYIRSRGGVNLGHLTGEARNLRESKLKQPGVITKRGLSWDDMETELRGEGYLQQGESLLDALDDAARGAKRFANSSAYDDQIDKETALYSVGLTGRVDPDDVKIILKQAVKNEEWSGLVYEVLNSETKPSEQTIRAFRSASDKLGISDRAIGDILRAGENGRSPEATEFAFGEASSAGAPARVSPSLTTDQIDRVREIEERLRSSGESVEKFLKQRGLTSQDELNPAEADLLRQMAANRKARRAPTKAEQSAMFETSPTVESKAEGQAREPQPGINFGLFAGQQFTDALADRIAEKQKSPVERTKQKIREESGAPKLYQERPKTFADVELPDEIKQPLLEIAQSFMQEGKTDYNSLVKEYESLLGGDFEYIASSLSAVVAEASRLHEQFKNNLIAARAVVENNKSDFAGLGLPTEAELAEAAQRKTDVDEINARTNQAKTSEATTKTDTYESTRTSRSEGARASQEQIALRVLVLPESLHGDASAAKGATNRGMSNAEVLSDFSQSLAFRNHGLGGFDVPSQRIVMARVIDALHDGQIRDAVIKNTSRAVVDNLVRLKSAAQVHLHDMSMLKDQLAIDPNGAISIRVDVADTAVRAVAGHSAENIATSDNLRGPSHNLGSADKAGERLARTGSTGVATEGPLSDLTRLPEKLSAAGKTSTVDFRHGAAPPRSSTVSGVSGSEPGTPIIPTDRSSFKKALIEKWGVDSEVAHRTAEIAEGFASTYAADLKATNPKIDAATAKAAFYRAIQVGSSESTGQSINQMARGATEFTKTGDAIISALNNPDASTGAHELSHAVTPLFFRLAGNPASNEGLKSAMRAMEDFMGFKPGEFLKLHQGWVDGTLSKEDAAKYRAGQEKNARGFEAYLREGNAPTRALRAAFEKFKEWLTAIYRRLKDSPIDVGLDYKTVRAWDRLLGGELEAKAAKIDETEHWNFKRSSFASPETEARFRDIVKQAAVESGGVHKVPVSRAEHLERVAKLSPDLLPEVKRLRESQIASREIFTAAAQYAQTLTNQAQELRAKITPATLPDEALRLEDKIAGLEHDATEIMAHTVGVRSEFGRNLALLAAQKTDQLSPEKVLAFGSKLAEQRGLEKNSQTWKSTARKLVGLSNTISSAQAEKRRIARERKALQEGAPKPKKEPWQSVMLSSLKSQAKEASARLQEQFGGQKLYQRETDLPSAAHDIATILAARVAEESQTKKGLPLDRILEEMRGSFPDVINQYESQIKATADSLLKDARRQALVSASRDPETQVSARRQLALDVAESRKAERQTQQAADLKRKQIDRMWEAEAEKAAKESAAAWDKANAEWQPIQAEMDQQAKADVEAQKAFERQQRLAVKEEAKRVSKAAQEAEQARLQDIADEARERMKADRQAAREAQKAGIAAEARARRQAERAQAREKRGVYYPITQAANEAQARLAQPDYTPTPEDLAAIAAEKSIQPDMTAARLHSEMQQYGEAYSKNIAQIRNLAADMRNDARANAARLRLETRAAGKAAGATRPEAKTQAREDYAKYQAEELARLAAEEKWQDKRIQTAKRDLAKEYAKLNRPPWWETALDVAGLPISLASSVDLPHLRQGLPTLVNHPRIWYKSLLKSASTWKESQMEQRLNELEDSPLSELARLSGLKQSGLESRRSPLSHLAREEGFQNRFLRMFPHAKISERQYTTAMDVMRDEVFRQHAEGLLKEFPPALHPEVYSELARVVNIMTGVGDLGNFTKYAPLLNRLVLYATRYMVSRFQMIGMLRAPFGGKVYRDAPAAVRKIAAKEAWGYVGKMSLLFGGLAALGLTSLNPDDNDFLKLKIPGTNQKWDLTGGMGGYAAFLFRLGQGGARTARGEKSFAGDSIGDTLERFARSKLAPLPGTYIDWKTGRTYTGEPFSWKDKAGSLVSPMVARDIYDAVQMDGVKGLLMVPFALLGGNVSAYRSREMADRTGSTAERYATGMLREKMGSEPETPAEYKRRTLIVEYAAAKKAGRPTDRIEADIVKNGGPLSREEQESLSKRIEQNPLQHAYPYLGEEQKQEVLKVATPAEREQIEPNYEKMSTRLKRLSESDEYKAMSPSQQVEAMKQIAQEVRKQGKHRQPVDREAQREKRSFQREVNRLSR